jgi:Txe/YoeB family toxin of Txe-Axe toxin-antitoxin module
MEKTAKEDDVSDLFNNFRLFERIWKDNSRFRRMCNLDMGSRYDSKNKKRRTNNKVKESQVAFADLKIKKDFESLKKGKFQDKQLYKFIERAISDLKTNSSYGIKIPKKLWPKEYSKKIQITNLLKYDLPNGWRLIYTIKEDSVAIISILLEWFPHKAYEKRFKYLFF